MSQQRGSLLKRRSQPRAASSSTFFLLCGSVAERGLHACPLAGEDRGPRGRAWASWCFPAGGTVPPASSPGFSFQMAEQLMTLAYDNGINLFDTAEVYAAGKYVPFLTGTVARPRLPGAGSGGTGARLPVAPIPRGFTHVPSALRASSK